MLEGRPKGILFDQQQRPVTSLQNPVVCAAQVQATLQRRRKKDQYDQQHRAQGLQPRGQPDQLAWNPQPARQPAPDSQARPPADRARAARADSRASDALDW